MRSHLLWILFAAGTCTACGGAAPPVKEVATTEAAIRSAQEVGAQDVPEASLYLRLAKEQHQKAREFIERDEVAEAQRLLERAQADAELALVLSKKTQEQRQAQALNQQVNQLRSELQEPVTE